MVILAVSDVVWQALIAACVTIILAAMNLWSKRSADRAAAAAAAHAAGVKTALQASNASTNAQLVEVAARVEEVHKATNSLTDRLVETSSVEAHARGLKEGREEKHPP